MHSSEDNLIFFPLPSEAKIWEIVTIKGFLKNTSALSQNTYICGRNIYVCLPSAPALRFLKRRRHAFGRSFTTPNKTYILKLLLNAGLEVSLRCGVLWLHLTGPEC